MTIHPDTSPDSRLLPPGLSPEAAARAIEAATQLPLTGLQLKEQGIASLERHRWVDEARAWAVVLCGVNGQVTSDSLHSVMGAPPHDNCYGAVFHDKRFVATGRIRSTRPEAHGREIRVWGLA